MKRLLIVTSLLLATIAGSYGQARGKEMKTKKLSKSESANLTPEQRLVHETDRKTKSGKKNKKLSTKQKAKIQKKQARSARRTKQPATAPRSKPKS
jgi:hypothetical protein